MAIGTGVAIFSILASSMLTARGQSQQRKLAIQKADVESHQAKSLVQALTTPIGPTAAEIEAQKQAKVAEEAKAAAEKRTSELEAGIKADTLAAATKKRSLIGLASTVKTSASGLSGAAPTEKKTLLGQGGAF